MMICEHKLAKDQVEVLKKAYMEEYNKLAKTTFTANQEAPVLGQSNNHITFLAAIKKVQEDVGPKNDASFEVEEVEEMLEIHNIRKEKVRRKTIKEIYKSHTVKRANSNTGLLTSFTIMGTNGDHMTVISDSGCTGAIIDQSVSAQDPPSDQKRRS